MQCKPCVVYAEGLIRRQLYLVLNLASATLMLSQAREAIRGLLEERQRQRAQKLAQQQQQQQQLQQQQQPTAGASAGGTASPGASRPAPGFSSPDRMLRESVVQAEAAAQGQDRQQARTVSPSWALLERRAPSASFGGAARPVSAMAWRPRIARDPAPGSYAGLEAAYASLSYIPRPPSAVIPRAAVRASSGAEEGGAWVPTAAALTAWRQLDVGAAIDQTKRRAPAVLISTAQLRPDSEDEEEARDASPGLQEVWPISYSQVEARVVGGTIMPLHPERTVQGEPEDGCGRAESTELALDPWGLDSVVRVSKPAWSFALADRWQQPDSGATTAHRLTLEPNLDFGRPRVLGIPRFAAFLNMQADAKRRRQAGGGGGVELAVVGAYDLERAWQFLRRHVPAPVIALAAQRWGLTALDALGRGGDEAVLELSRAVLAVRPRPPAWGFAPLPTAVRRLPAEIGAAAMGLPLQVELAVLLVKRRVPAMPMFDLQLGRYAVPDDSAPGPGFYDAQFTQTERRATTFPFDKYLSHGILDSDDEGDEEEEPSG